MKYFVTGATGFIGERLVQRLVGRGDTVHALYRSEAKAAAIVHPLVRLFKGDITDVASLERGMTGCDGVFHAAAYAKVWAKDPSTYRRLNLDATRTILDLARRLGGPKVVFTSTGGVIGPSSGGAADEKTVRTVPFFNDYERTKAAAEEVARGFAALGQDVVIVNPTRVFGPGLISESNSVTRMIKLYRTGRFRILPGNGRSVGNYVFIDDVVDGHILAMEKGRSGERYILGGPNVSYLEFFAELAKITGRSRRMVRLPLPVMLAASGAMHLFARWFGIPPLITPEWVRKYLYDWVLSSDKAVRELGYHMTPLAEAFRKTVAWLDEGENARSAERG